MIVSSSSLFDKESGIRFKSSSSLAAARMILLVEEEDVDLKTPSSTIKLCVLVGPGDCCVLLLLYLGEEKNENEKGKIIATQQSHRTRQSNCNAVISCFAFVLSIDKKMGIRIGRQGYNKALD
jgi:hypothetical protein